MQRSASPAGSGASGSAGGAGIGGSAAAGSLTAAGRSAALGGARSVGTTASGGSVGGGGSAAAEALATLADMTPAVPGASAALRHDTLCHYTKPPTLDRREVVPRSAIRAALNQTPLAGLPASADPGAVAHDAAQRVQLAQLQMQGLTDAAGGCGQHAALAKAEPVLAQAALPAPASAPAAGRVPAPLQPGEGLQEHGPHAAQAPNLAHAAAAAGGVVAQAAAAAAVKPEPRAPLGESPAGFAGSAMGAAAGVWPCSACTCTVNLPPVARPALPWCRSRCGVARVWAPLPQALVSLLSWALCVSAQGGIA